MKTNGLVCITMVLAMTVQSVYSYSQEIIHESNNKDEIKNIIIAWAKSLNNFAGSYTLAQSSYLIEYGQLVEDGTKEWKIEYRYEGDNFFFRKEQVFPVSKEPTIDIFSFYNGAYDSLTQHSGIAHGVVNDTARNRLPFPWGTYLLPEEIFGQRMRFSLEDVLIDSTSRLVEHESGTRVLSIINKYLESAVDVTLDENNHIKQIQWLRRPFQELPDHAIAWNNEIADLKINLTTLEYNNYQLINGVLFPTEVVKTWWQLDKELAESVNVSFENGNITQNELTVKLYSIPTYPVNVQTFVLHDAKVNIAMSKNDFSIDWPKGTRIFKAKNMPQPGDIIPPERRISFNIATALVLSIIIVVIAICTALYIKNR